VRGSTAGSAREEFAVVSTEQAHGFFDRDALGHRGIYDVASPGNGGSVLCSQLESMVRDAMREQALTPKAAETPISVVQLSDHPRLRGAAALILTPAFAAPTIA